MTGVRDTGCERILERVSLGLDSEISQLEQALLDAHLRRCPGCAGAAAEMRALAGALRTAPVERPSRPVFVAQARRHPVRSDALKVAIAATLAVLAAGLGVLAGSVGGDPAAPPDVGASDIALLLPSADDQRDLRGVRTLPARDPEARLGGV